MSRFKTDTGVVVSIADEDDHYLRGHHYKKLRSSRHSDEPTPSGSIRRPHTEETPTGQIRRQQAQDPFGSR
jgi:hypothetical protein